MEYCKHDKFTTRTISNNIVTHTCTVCKAIKYITCFGEFEWVSSFRQSLQNHSTNYTESKDRKVYNIDFDGVLTTGEFTDNPNPRTNIIKRVNELLMSGHLIIIWTARWWDEANFLVGWLISHKVKFHGVMMGKGGSDIYVDDKMIDLDEFMDR